MAMVRKQVRWATGRRKGKSRLWKSKWVMVWVPDVKSDGRPAAKPEAGRNA
ncbi:MAG: hypothetical protein SFZ23_13150 [Planctomycetota bacterium]|nr:hypothetical protein [Planctomycetota bacterium]